MKWNSVYSRRSFGKLAGMATLLTCFKAEAEPRLQSRTGGAFGMDGAKLPPDELQLTLNWQGHECRPILRNLGKQAVRVREVTLLEYTHSLPPDTWVYGESFQMLTQTDSKLGALHEIGFKEQQHYRIPGPKDAFVVTNLLTLAVPQQENLLLAYTSSHRFVGRFYLRDGSISAVVDTEGLLLKPGESWQLETFTFLEGMDRAALLALLADKLNEVHPHRTFQPIPMGWCSWYSYATDISAAIVERNLEVIHHELKDLKYIQIDDGYQPAMGDWLDKGKSFGGDVQFVMEEVRNSGQEPAIWVAPFIASTNSRILKEHPDWFVQNAAGKPMPAAEVSFTGWGSGGWYCLDGTHPAVQAHLEEVFRVMREQWKCTYFKLDANFWGAIHGGRFHDPTATRVQAYRRGMEAVRRGARDAFLLGCNHPIWPSLGLIDGSRSSGDIARDWKTVSSCMQETMDRNWQNGRLWWNDPDAVLLTSRSGGPMKGSLTEEEFRFHATAAYASGGMILSGDDLTEIPPARLSMLRKLMPPTGVAAIFDDASTLEVGRITTKAARRIVLFNRGAEARTVTIYLRGSYLLSEIWTGETLGLHHDSISLTVPAHGARILDAMPHKHK